jgi:hypothetical protein
MNDLLPYQHVIHILFRVTFLLLVALLLVSIVLERQVSFARKHAGDPDWQRWFGYPKLAQMHRKMFPKSSLRLVALGLGLLVIANMLLTRDLIHRDQQHLDAARIALINQAPHGHR